MRKATIILAVAVLAGGLGVNCKDWGRPQAWDMGPRLAFGDDNIQVSMPIDQAIKRGADYLWKYAETNHIGEPNWETLTIEEARKDPLSSMRRELCTRSLLW